MTFQNLRLRGEPEDEHRGTGSPPESGSSERVPTVHNEVWADFDVHNGYIDYVHSLFIEKEYIQEV